MMRTLPLIGVLALQACDRGESIPAAGPSAPETGATAAVAKLNETLRNGVLEKAIRAAGVACPSVLRSERAEIATGVMGWKAECDNNTAHLIQIQSDGTAKVTSRTN